MIEREEKDEAKEIERDPDGVLYVHVLLLWRMVEIGEMEGRKG